MVDLLVSSHVRHREIDGLAIRHHAGSRGGADRFVRFDPFGPAAYDRFVMTADEPGGGPPGEWTRRHYRQVIGVRVLLAAWILFVTVFLCVKRYWWGLVFLPFLALDLWLLRGLVRYAHRADR